MRLLAPSIDNELTDHVPGAPANGRRGLVSPAGPGREGDNCCFGLGQDREQLRSDSDDSGEGGG